MPLEFLKLISGLTLLYLGGEALVRGASGLGIRAGLTPLTVGLTVVAFGTSSPELFVSISAGLQSKPDIALANVIGSNICNIGLILACSALLHPLSVQVKLVRLDFPILISITAIFCWFLTDQSLSFFESALLSIGLILYCTMTFLLASQSRETISSPELAQNDSLRLISLMIVVGLSSLTYGAELFVDSAVNLASSFGISQGLIGLTVVAVGTSLPELATSLVAAFRGQADLAVGNIIGSNIFNILGVAGISGLIVPLTTSSLSTVDLGIMFLFTFVSLPLCRTGWKVSRIEGAFILAMYATYVIYRIAT